MLKLCNIDIEHCQEIYKRLNKFLCRLKKRFAITTVYLYGSFAKEEVHEGSDIDLVIVGNFKGRMFERIEEILKLTELPIEPLVYTQKEFLRLKNKSFLRKIIKTAKLL